MIDATVNQVRKRLAIGAHAFADPKLKHRRMRVELSQKPEPGHDPG